MKIFQAEGAAYTVTWRLESEFGTFGELKSVEYSWGTECEVVIRVRM